MWELVIGAGLAIVGGVVANWASHRMGRARWISERRYDAYVGFFNQWEEARSRLRASDSEFEESMRELAIAARPIDLLGDHRGRNAAWAAYKVLQDARDEVVSDGDIKDRINQSLNDFKRDIGVARQSWGR